MTLVEKIDLTHVSDDAQTSIDLRHDSGEWALLWSTEDAAPTVGEPAIFLDPCAAGRVEGQSVEDALVQAAALLQSVFEATAETSTQPDAARTDVGAKDVSPLRRHFTRADVDPYDELEWESDRTAIIAGADGKPVFEQKGVEFPKGWSQNATNVVASQYFRGPPP